MDYDIIYLMNYPMDGNHLELIISLPCEITKGKDPYWFKHNGKEYETKPQYWYCDFNGLFIDSHSKGFVSEKKAVNWAINKYSEYLKTELERIQ